MRRNSLVVLAVGAMTVAALALEMGRSIEAGPTANAPGNEPERAGAVDVFVTDTHNVPIAGAEVLVVPSPGFLETERKQTGADGHARIEKISRRQPPVLHCIKNGYARSNFNGPIEFGPGEEVAHFQVSLSPLKSNKPGVFVGRVTDATSAPLSGVTVAWGYDYAVTSGGTARTDGAGQYRLEAGPTPGYVAPYLTAFGAGWAPAFAKGAKPESSDAPAKADFVLARGHRVKGRVTTEDGAPVVGALAWILVKVGENNDFHVPGQDWRARTDGSGCFEFRDLPKGKITACVSGKGWSGVNYQAMALDAETTFVLRKAGVICGRALNAKSGAPLKDFVVRLLRPHTYYEVRAMGEAFQLEYARHTVGELFHAEDGRFVLREVSLGTMYGMAVEAPGYLAAQKDSVEPKGEDAKAEIVFRLEKGRPLVGELVDAATSRPIADAPVTLLPPTYNRSSSVVWGRPGLNGRDCQFARTGEKGAFSFIEGSEPGLLTIHVKGYQRLVVTPADRSKYASDADLPTNPPRGSSETSVETRLRITLFPGASVRGIVSIGRKPCVGARMSLNRYSSPPSPVSEFLPYALCDNTGAYAFQDLSPGHYGLQADVTTTQSSELITRFLDLAARESKAINVDVQSGRAALSGQIQDGEEPIVRAGLNLAPSPRSDYSFTGEADTDGAYRVEGLPEGEYRVTVTRRVPRDDASLTASVTIKGETRRDFLFPARRKVTARLAFPEGFPPAVRSKYWQAFLNLKDNAKPPAGVDARSEGRFEDGRIHFQGRLKGVYRLSLECDVASGDRRWFNVEEDFAIDNLKSDQDLGDVPAPVIGGFAIFGVVTNEKGEPLDGIYVSASPNSPAHSPNASAHTGSDGSYRIPYLAPGSYNVSADKIDEHGRRIVSDGKSQQIDKDTQCDFKLRSANQVTAQLAFATTGSRQNESAFYAAHLEAAPSGPGRRPDDADRIDSGGYGGMESGRARFYGRFRGDYHISVDARVPDGVLMINLPQTFRLDNLSDDQDLGKVTVPEPGPESLNGRVVDESGAPLAGARIDVWPQFDSRFSARGVSNEQGRFRFSGLEPGEHWIEITKFQRTGANDIMTHRLKETVSVGGEAQHDFAAKALRAVKARLAFPSSMPEPLRSRYEIARIRRAGGQGEPHADIDESADSQVREGNLLFTGRFKGYYQLMALFRFEDGNLLDGTLAGTVALDNLQADQDLGSIEAPAPGSSFLSGTVYDEHGDPLPGATIYLHPRFATPWDQQYGGAGPDGQYRVSLLAEGEYDATAQNQTGSVAPHQEATVRVVINGETRLDFHLLRHNRLTLRFTATDANGKDATARLNGLCLVRKTTPSPEEAKLAITSAIVFGARIENGVAVVTGRFLGNYQLWLYYKPSDPSPSFSYPAPLALDNLDTPQDVGPLAVTLPVE